MARPLPLSSLQRALQRISALVARIQTFEALPETEGRVLAALAFMPCVVHRAQLVSWCRIFSLRVGSKTVDGGVVTQLAERWKECGLIDWDGSRLRCDTDFGTYLVRQCVETHLGTPFRIPNLYGAQYAVNLETEQDERIYRVRLRRLSGHVPQAVSEAAAFLASGGKDGRVAELFGPGDPWFVPKHLPDWETLLSRSVEFGVRELEDHAWHIELFEALTSDAPEAASALLLPADAAQLEIYRTRVSKSQLKTAQAYRQLLYTWHLFQGNETRVRELLHEQQGLGIGDAWAYEATLQLCHGNLAQSLELFERGFATPKKNLITEAQCSWVGAMHILALLASQTPEHLQLAAELLQKLAGKKTRKALSAETAALVELSAYYDWLTGATVPTVRNTTEVQASPIAFLLALVLLGWSPPHPSSAKGVLPNAERVIKTARRLGHKWIEHEVSSACHRLVPPKTASAVAKNDMRPQALVDLVVPKAEWQLTLESLARVAESANPTSVPSANNAVNPARIAWIITIFGDRVAAEPRLQVRKGAGFSRGRPIALERLMAPVDPGLPITSADLAIAAHITSRYHGYGAVELRLDERVALALVGHPYVFEQLDETIHYDVKKGEIWLRCERTKEGAHRLLLEPKVPTGSREFEPGLSELLVRKNGSELVVYEVTTNVRKVAQLLGEEYWLPAEAEPQLKTLLPRLSALVPTSANLTVEDTVATIPGETIPVLRILPRVEALRVQLVVTPFGADGPAVCPGVGGESLSDFKEGSARHVRRDLVLELERAEEVISRLSVLGGASESYVWTAEGLGPCLQLISEVAKLKVEESRVEWPEGQPLKLRQVQKLRISITGGDASRWFEADGAVELADDSELRIAEILMKLRRTEGRFVELGPGDYVELSEGAMKRLRLLESFRASVAGDEQLRLAPWFALAWPESSDSDVEHSGTAAWENWRARVLQAQQRKVSLSKNFQGTLRDYQLEGFTWLCRMAVLGTGVCLGDDMGLGKTIQALALLQHRATRKALAGEVTGPMLIVAPASVCPGWLSESEKFTPDLQPRWLTGLGRSLGTLTRKSVVVCTYEILHRDIKELSAVTWDTVVLDEAHNIKNAHTQRARSAYALNAGFRLATTGTPIENHLGELWSLYRFLMPGLLGEQAQFVERFRAPIENQRDVAKRQQLQELIRPFLLRRTKQQVLSELPPRTELVRQVELSKPEMELYEALRIRGLEALKSPGKDQNQQRVRVLAELMRLRRACCHPRLVLEDSDLPSSKLAAFLELVSELRDGGHRALVFSQFVGHLALVREALDDQGIPYQYLDGQTPVVERGKRVADFQAGSGDLFLISLRAGGTGLNLTAADYVIHLDPWWNPAVEDQASDRAHRIGQERPVTIYRLVTRGTIEERLVAMHAAKRTLAADILEGSEDARRLDPDELLNLLREAAISEG